MFNTNEIAESLRQYRQKNGDGGVITKAKKIFRRYRNASILTLVVSLAIPASLYWLEQSQWPMIIGATVLEAVLLFLIILFTILAKQKYDWIKQTIGPQPKESKTHHGHGNRQVKTA